MKNHCRMRERVAGRGNAAQERLGDGELLGLARSHKGLGLGDTHKQEKGERERERGRDKSKDPTERARRISVGGRRIIADKHIAGAKERGRRDERREERERRRERGERSEERGERRQERGERREEKGERREPRVTPLA